MIAQTHPDLQSKEDKALRYTDTLFTEQGVVHQILSTISNSESTNFFKRIFIKISFSTCKMRKKKPSFEPIKSLFSFSTTQTEKNSWKKFVEKIRETNW